MQKANAISNGTAMLLTSGGVTTDRMRQRLLEMGRLSDTKYDIKVLRIADGWQHFSKSDPVGKLARAEHYVEGPASQVWSNRYLRWVLGRRAIIETVLLDGKEPEEVKTLLKQTDLLVAPGANTYQLIRGIKPFAGLIRQAVARGLPYLGDSAGSIIAGHTIKPASMKPADICPDTDLLNAPGLGLVGADIVVHAEGTQGGFDIHGPIALVAKFALACVASDSNNYKPEEGNTIVYALNEQQALLVKAGQVQLI